MKRKDRRPWRKLVKKLRRKRIRQQLAIARDAELKNSDAESSNESDTEERVRKEEEDRWLERERQAQLEFERKKAEEQRRKEAEEAEKERIREEWQEIQAKKEAERKERERQEKEEREKQVFYLPGQPNSKRYYCRYDGRWVAYRNKTSISSWISSLDSENPPLPYLMPNDPTAGEVPVCPSFVRTAACRFSPGCKKSHPKPTLSHTILIPNFFSHFSLEKAYQDESDQHLEYEDSELYREFLVFYYDVLPELKSVGEVMQFKVCCNVEPHLRGNVYVQFRTIREAVDAYRKFNGRFYDGRQLSLEFIKIDSWRSAICGLFQRKRCPKIRTCNFLHVFRNPTKEFVRADNDWKQFPERPKPCDTPQRQVTSATQNTSRASAQAAPNTQDETEKPPESNPDDKCDRRKRTDEDKGHRSREEERSRNSKRRRDESSGSREPSRKHRRKSRSRERSDSSRDRRHRKHSKKKKKHKHKHKHKKHSHNN